MNSKRLFLTLITVFVLIGVFYAGRGTRSNSHFATTTADGVLPAPEKETIWTCSMHPQVRQPAPGDCPICAMDLIPLATESDDSDGDLPILRLSARSVALMHVQTAPVERREAYADLRLPGRIAIDETRTSLVSAWFGGRVDRLYVDFAGAQVQKGEHLAEIYSPQLFGAQEEFLQSINRADPADSINNPSLLDAAGTKLRLLGLSNPQIEQIQNDGSPNTHLTYYSPATGTVLERFVTTGQYLETGTPMYSIADLSHVWVELEAYESELEWLRLGQEVSIASSAFPDETFTGRIANIDPELTAAQRTTRIRVNLSNDDRKLKPGMLVTGNVHIRVGDGGKIHNDALAGRWISPMHPEIVKDGPGNCDVCGMELVPAETMGYFATSNGAVANPLVIPASAPLFTGKRSVVYVRLPETDDNPRPSFEARTVHLGNRLGNLYPVIDGLAEGELVVTHGQFKIDSELQIRGRPSMMTLPPPAPAESSETSPDPREPPAARNFTAEVPESFSKELVPLTEAYLDFVAALAGDDAALASSQFSRIAQRLETIGEHRLKGDAHIAWMRQYTQFANIFSEQPENDLHTLRSHLQALTFAMESTYAKFGNDLLPAVNRAHCPMVEGGVDIDGGSIGTWLQRSEQVANPYWGAAMLRCGEIHGTL